MYNTVVSDLDGTLLNDNHDVSEETIETIRNLDKKGIRFIIATGRTLYDANRIRKKIGLDIAMITANGVELIDEKQNILHQHILAEDICDYLLNLPVKNYGEIYRNCFYDDKWIVDDIVPKDHVMNDWINNEWFYEYFKIKDIQKEKILKFLFVGDHEALLELEKEIESTLKDRVNYAFTLPTCLEIFSKDATKGKALEKLASIKNIDLNKVVAFGDGFNDLEMLSICGKAYIPDNASCKLKNALSHIEVIGKSNDNAVAKKIKELFL